MSEEELFKTIKDSVEVENGFVGNNHFKILELKKQYCVMEAEITENSLNYVNIVHGGFIFGLADTAGGIAALTSGRKVVTVNANIDYFLPAEGKKLKAVATCLKDGKRLAVYEVNIYDDKNDKVAHVGLSYFYIS